MSLTSFLELPEVKARFKQDWPLPSPRPVTKDWLWVAPPMSSRPAVIGTAFDYIFRFHLRRLNSMSGDCEPWIAEAALGRMKGSLREVGQEICATARERHQEFLDGRPVTDGLLSSAVLLAQLDGVFRSGGMLPSLGEFSVSPEDLADLRQLVACCDWTLWSASQQCRLNPAFGLASALVSGADADFQLDATLYELKTVRQVKSFAEHYHQLIGYSVLNYLNSGPPITELAVYYSRFGRTVRWPAPDWTNVQHEPFLLWLYRTATQKFDCSGALLAILLDEGPAQLLPQLESLAAQLQVGKWIRQRRGVREVEPGR